jgi:hypothetical protein
MATRTFPVAVRLLCRAASAFLLPTGLAVDLIAPFGKEDRPALEVRAPSQRQGLFSGRCDFRQARDECVEEPADAEPEMQATIDPCNSMVDPPHMRGEIERELIERIDGRSLPAGGAHSVGKCLESHR